MESISSWVRVVATRTALNLVRGKKREVSLDENDILAAGAESDDAEMRHLKTLYRSEFLLKHGFVDRIVHRRDLRTELARIIDYCEH